MRRGKIVARIDRVRGSRDRAGQAPAWVIEHMITLCEYAESQGYSAFEARLVEATEALLAEVQTKRSAPRKVCDKGFPAQSNVVPFAPVLA